MKTEEINDLVQNVPALQSAREKLEAMRDGTYCEHNSWGFGQIKKYDAKNRRLIIDFSAEDNNEKPDKLNHPMDPAFCVKHLTLFADDDIRVRQKKDPKAVADLVKKDPVGFVKGILLAAPRHNLSTIELEKILKQVVIKVVGKSDKDAKYKKWWADAKKRLELDPDVATPDKKDGYFALREDPLSPEDEILDEYRKTKNTLQKILLAEQLFITASPDEATLEDNADGDEVEPDKEVAAEAKKARAKVAKKQIHLAEEDLHLIFDELTAAIASSKRITRSDPNEEEGDKEAKEHAARLHGIWVRNDLCRHFKQDVDQLAPTSRSIIEYCKEKKLLSGLAAHIPQTPPSLERLLDLITRVYLDEPVWSETILDLLKESTGKLTAECIKFLDKKKHSDVVGTKLLEWLNSRELRSPVITWVIKNRATDKYSEIVSPLINYRLLSAIIRAIDHEAIHANSTRRIPLVEVLSGDKNLIQDLLGVKENASEGDVSAEEEEARGEIACDIAQSLNLSQGFDPLTKKSLLARFIEIYNDGKKAKTGKIGKIRKKIFDKLQDLVAGETEETEELVVSQESLDARKEELRDIIQNQIPENKKAIALAKEHGDLKENSEYKMARQDQEILAARRGQLEVELRLARVTDFSEAKSDVVGIGSVVELLDNDTGKHETFTILGAWDSDPDKNILSYKTPLAQQLLRKTAGESVQTEIGGNTKNWTIKSIARWVDKK